MLGVRSDGRPERLRRCCAPPHTCKSLVPLACAGCVVRRVPSDERRDDRTTESNPHKRKAHTHTRRFSSFRKCEWVGHMKTREPRQVRGRRQIPSRRGKNFLPSNLRKEVLRKATTEALFGALLLCADALLLSHSKRWSLKSCEPLRPQQANKQKQQTLSGEEKRNEAEAHNRACSVAAALANIQAACFSSVPHLKVNNQRTIGGLKNHPSVRLCWAKEKASDACRKAGKKGSLQGAKMLSWRSYFLSFEGKNIPANNTQKALKR